MSDYESWLGVVLPPWAQGEWGTRFREALGGILDVTALGSTGGAGEASKAHFVGIAPQDSIRFHGADRWIHSVPGENAEAYRERLLDCWDSISSLGPKAGLKALICDVLGTQCEIYDVSSDNWLAGYAPGNFEDANADNWSRLWIVVAEPHPWTGLIFGPAITFGPAQSFGLNISQAQVSLLRQAIQQYRPAHMLPVEAWFITDATSAAALKANHAVTANVVRIPLLIPTWYSWAFRQFGSPKKFGERFQ